MKRSIPPVAVAGLFVTATLALDASAASITDGDFSAWDYGATGTATVIRETSGGNPGERLNFTTVSGNLVYGTAIKSDYSTINSLAGKAFTLALEVFSGPGSYGNGQAIQLLVEQNGTVYGNFLGTTGYPMAWNQLIFTGTFSAGAFSRMIGSGSAMPDFSGNTLTRFGFAAGNSGSGTLTQYYDNFSLDSVAITPVPEPETYALMLAGLGLVGFSVKQRKGQRTFIQKGDKS